jgi:hypothetical protein
MDEFEEIAKPLIEFIRKNYHPHVTVIVTNEYAEILEGIKVVKPEKEDLK